MRPSSPGDEDVGSRDFVPKMQPEISNLGWQNPCDGSLEQLYAVRSYPQL
jgi:hypothetical protein